MSENELMISQGMELGKIFAESGLFPDIKSAAQGYIKILAGRELNMTPMQALNAFYFVNGKIGIVGNAVAALIKNSKKYDYVINTLTNTECSITFYSLNATSTVGLTNKEKIGESVFTIKDAAAAGLVNKDVWKNYTRNMLFNRALMNGSRWYCPDIMSSAPYSVEELEDLTTAPNMQTIEITTEGNVENGKSNQEKAWLSK